MRRNIAVKLPPPWPSSCWRDRRSFWLLFGGIGWCRSVVPFARVEAIRDQVVRLTATRLDETVRVPNTHDEVAALAVTMIQMLARLSAARPAQLRFIAFSSHELCSSLNCLSSLLDEVRTDDSLWTWRELEPMWTTEAVRCRQSGRACCCFPVSAAPGLPPPDRMSTWTHGVGRGGRLRASTALTVITDVRATRVSGDRAAQSQVLRNLCDKAARHARTVVKITAWPG